MAKQLDWQVLLRIDDLDGPRNKPGAVAAAQRDLRWLGLDWGQMTPLPSSRVPHYENVVTQISQAGRVFPCSCSRADVIATASAVSEDGAAVYQGACSGRAMATRTSGDVLRLQVEGQVVLSDLQGRVEAHDLADLGAFVIQRADGGISYQLASAVDDFDYGVTHIVRGDDLRDSSVRQTYLRRLLYPGAGEVRYLHLPLVVGVDGRKLAKRHGDTRVAQLRELSWSPGRVRQLLAGWCNFNIGEDDSIEAWVEAFDVARISSRSVVCDPKKLGIYS